MPVDARIKTTERVAAQSAVSASPQLMVLGLALAGCSSTLLYTEPPPTKPIRTARPSHGAAIGDPARASAHPCRLQRRLRGCQARSACSTRRSQKLVAASERPDMQLPRHHPQLAGGQRLRAADRTALRHARPDRARQRHLRARLGAVARNVARDRAATPPCARTRPARSRWSTRVVHRPAAAIRRPARWRSPNPRSSSRASRARRNSRPTASASASRRAPATTLTARCGS